LKLKSGIFKKESGPSELWELIAKDAAPSYSHGYSEFNETNITIEKIGNCALCGGVRDSPIVP
jgi:hypothetical protein